MTRLILTVSVLLFMVMIFSLTLSAEEQSSLPVGVVDYDRTQSSGNLIADLKNVPALKIVESNEKELHKLLLDEMITSFFVINKGYEEKLQAGDLNGILTAYYKENNKSASIISDIVAGEMMYPICYNKALHLYEKIPFAGQKHTKALYEEYMEQLQSTSKDFDFAFQMNYENPENNITQDNTISNAVLYHQLIIGILGILMAFIAMFILSVTVREKETGVSDRLKLSGFHAMTQDIGNFAALFLVEGLISLVFSGLVFARLDSEDIMLFASSYLLLLLNALVLGGIFLIFSKLIRSMIVYQLLCSILILITGGLGFYHLLTGFYQSFLDGFIKFIPNSWFIQGFTDIIIYGSAGGYLKQGHLALLVMSGAVAVIIIILNILGRTFRIQNTNNKWEQVE